MSIANSIKQTMVPIHPEGYKFIGIFAVATLLLGWLWGPLFYVGLALTAWCAYFFRDPQRHTPQGDDLVISPADGVVSAVGVMAPPSDLGMSNKEMLRISVFMNVFNCHVNRAPMAGPIERVVYKKGKFLNAELDKASEENERNGLVISSAKGEIAVVQIAGLVARRILCWSKQGETLAQGERFGLIRFGSRLDVYLPVEAKAAVSVGQTAIAGETLLATFGNNPLSNVSVRKD